MTTARNAIIACLVASAASFAAARPATAEEAALAAAKTELARMQGARDSVAAERWALRRQTMDLRESWNVEYERVSDSLDAAAARRGRLLGEIDAARPREADEEKPAVDPALKQGEELRQAMIERLVFLRDRAKNGIPWRQQERVTAIGNALHAVEGVADPLQALAAFRQAHDDEWTFSREIDREEGYVTREDGSQAKGMRLRIAGLGAWYLTEDNKAGVLAKAGEDASWVWREGMAPAAERAVVGGMNARDLSMPVDPVGTRAEGPGYFKEVERGFWEKLLDMKTGPFSQATLMGARAILVLLIVLGISIFVVSWVRGRFVKREMADVEGMRARLREALSDRKALSDVVGKSDAHTVAGRLVRTGWENQDLSPESLEQMMVSQESLEERNLEHGLGFLGNVASNAAFIGLLGTVLGILDAFAHLGTGGQDGAQKVMAAIAEALVATATGLAVAIPAVVLFNNLSHRVRKVMAEARELRHLIVAASLDAAARTGEVRGG